MEYGYACINTELAKDKITTNRTLRRKTLAEKGISYYENLVIANLLDLKKILEWNESNNIRFFRISADLFTHRDQIIPRDLPSYNNIIKPLLRNIGNYIKDHNHRVSIHADHFTILASQRDDVVNNSITDLNFFGKIFDLMGLDRSPYYKINVHVGTFRPSKQEAANRFLESFYKLNDSARSRLTVENDDSPNGFSTVDLFHYIYKKHPIPIVFDYHHHSLNSGNMSEESALNLAHQTWGDIKPVVHYSSSKRLNEDNSAKDIAHADYVYEKIQTYDLDFDIMLEAKMKEQAVLKYSKALLNT